MIRETWALKADICGRRCSSAMAAVPVVPVEGGQLPVLTALPSWREVWGALEWAACPFPAAIPPSWGTTGGRQREDDAGVIPWVMDGTLKYLEIGQSICPVNKWLPACSYTGIHLSFSGIDFISRHLNSFASYSALSWQALFLREGNPEQALENKIKAPSFVSGVLTSSQVPPCLEEAVNFRQIPRNPWVQWLYCSADMRGLVWRLWVMAVLW